jgi:hypothetical protein
MAKAKLGSASWPTCFPGGVPGRVRIKIVSGGAGQPITGDSVSARWLK